MVDARRAINSRATARGTVDEVVSDQRHAGRRNSAAEAAADGQGGGPRSPCTIRAGSAGGTDATRAFGQLERPKCYADWTRKWRNWQTRQT